MKRRQRAQSVASGAAEAQPGLPGDVGDGESASKCLHREDAGCESSASRAGGEPGRHDRASESPHESEPEAGEQEAATSGHGQRLPNKPPESTITPQPTQLHLAIASQFSHRSLTVSTSIRCGAVIRNYGVWTAIKHLARRVRTFPEGTHPPSPLPHLLDKLTDEMLLVAKDAVAAVAAEGKALSGKQQYRLLAWTVADARGAELALDKPLAETVGKRLERQANRVRAALAEAAAIAEAARAHAQSSIADPTALAAELEKIDDAEADVREYHEYEVYIGFTELDTLLQPPPSESPAVDVSTAGEPVSGVQVSTQTEQMDHAALSDALHSLRWKDAQSEPAHSSPLALLQSALDHIIELDARLAGEQAVTASLRADAISERARAARAESLAAEAEMRACEVERRLRRQEEEAEEALGDLQDERAAADMDHVREVKVLKGEIRGLKHELALLKGIN